MLKGNNLILSINGTPLGAARTCGIDRNTDTIEKCSPVDGPARSFITGATSWSISAGGLYANKEAAERLRAIWRKYQRGGVQTPLAIHVSTDEGATESGQAILTNLKEQGDHGSLVKFSIQLQGTGPLLGEPYVGKWSMLAPMKYMDFAGTAEDEECYIGNETDPQRKANIGIMSLHMPEGGVVKIDNPEQYIYVLCRGVQKDFAAVASGSARQINSSLVYWAALETKTITLEPGEYCVLANSSDGYPYPYITVE